MNPPASFDWRGYAWAFYLAVAERQLRLRSAMADERIKNYLVELVSATRDPKAYAPHVFRELVGLREELLVPFGKRVDALSD